MGDLNNIIRLKESQVKPAAEVLARAFYDDPSFVYIIPDDPERKDRLVYLFQLSLQYGIGHGEVYATSPNLEGIAVWLPSEALETSFWETTGLSQSPLAARIDKEAIDKLQVLTDYCTTLHERHAPFRHWFLEELAVDPVFQGRGYGSTLLRAMLSRIDREGLPCYVRTQNGRNVPFYRRFGFKLIEEGEFPGTGIKNWCLLRGGGG